MAEESLLPAKGSSPGFQRYSPAPGGPTAAAVTPPEAPPAPPAPVQTTANGKVKEAHKRQISQAIPRNERDNGKLSRPEAAPASSRSTQGGTQEGTQEGTREGTQEGTRKSVRARKPKMRN
jgi:flagellar biosynthesis/type III secretory pathway protein FliH